jgi:transposase InsO family protein
MGLSNEAVTEAKQDYLKRIYTDPSHPASFSGPARLKREVDREGKYDISTREIKTFLESQDTYSTNRPIHRRFKRNRIVVGGVRQQYDMDLCDMSKLRRYRGNRGTSFLLVVIDVFSRFAYVRPLKNKSGEVVSDALREILVDGGNPVRCRSDRGAEFKSKNVQDLLRRLGIKHYFTTSELKCQPVERLNQTLKSAIYKWCYENKSFAYITVLDELVNGYNHRVHSALFGLSPSEVNESNQARLWNLMYVGSGKGAKGRQRIRVFKYNVGDLVRISLAKKTFERSFTQKFTDNIYKIRGRVYRENVPVYFLMDIEEEPIKPSFYEAELQRVQKNLDDPSQWEIEKIIRTRKVGHNQEVFVRFRGLGPKFDRWILKSSIGSKTT